MSEWHIDGERSATIDIDDRLVQYGDGLFETIAIRGGRPRLLEYHVERLLTGCERLGIGVPAAERLVAMLDEALRRASIPTGNCTAKLLVSAGSGRRGYRRPDAPAPRVLIGVFESGPTDHRWYVDGVEVRICELRLALQPQLAGMKTANRLEQVLARQEWSDDRIFEGLTLDTEGRLICGTMSNVFLVIDNAFVTPAITRCGVSGVMRRHVLTLLEESGQSCDIRDVELDEFWNAQEVLLTNSHFGCVPVSRCRDRRWEPGPKTQALMQRMAKNGIEECGT